MATIPTQPANIPPPQLAVSQFPNPALAGQPDGSWYRDVVSRLADVVIQPGFGVAYGATAGEVKVPTVSTDVTAGFIGVALMQELKEPNGPPGGPYIGVYKVGDALPVMKKGRVWCWCEDTMVDKGQVFCVFTVADTRTLGSFVASALAGTSAALVPNAKVIIGGVGTHASPQLCLIEFAEI